VGALQLRSFASQRKVDRGKEKGRAFALPRAALRGYCHALNGLVTSHRLPEALNFQYGNQSRPYGRTGAMPIRLSF